MKRIIFIAVAAMLVPFSAKAAAQDNQVMGLYNSLETLLRKKEKLENDYRLPNLNAEAKRQVSLQLHANSVQIQSDIRKLNDRHVLKEEIFAHLIQRLTPRQFGLLQQFFYEVGRGAQPVPHVVVEPSDSD